MTTRREFVNRSAAMFAASSMLTRRFVSSPDRAPPVVLFQGDSITDAGRDRSIAAPNDVRALGSGYPRRVFEAVRAARPGFQLDVFNRGVSGNTVPDLAARWKADTLDLKPTILSILIGVNDVWHTLGKTPADEVVRTYESGYTALLERTRTALPGVHIVVLEPFVLRVGAVNESWFPEFDQLRAACRRVADRAGAQFIGLHDLFQQRAATTAPADWAADGVHPTPAGHDLIAKTWIDSVRLT